MDDANLPDLASEDTTGPGRFAWEWVGAVLADDVTRAWAAMSEELRLALAQMWIYQNPGVVSDPRARGLDRDGLAGRLLRADAADGLFINMSSVEVRTVRQGFGVTSLDQLVIGSHPRPIGVDLELVRLLFAADLEVGDSGDHVFAPGSWARGVSVFVSGVDRERQVAGFGEALLHPGWPPVWEKIIGPED